MQKKKKTKKKKFYRIDSCDEGREINKSVKKLLSYKLTIIPQKGECHVLFEWPLFELWYSIPAFLNLFHSKSR